MSDGLKEKYRRAIIDILSSDEKVERIVLFGFRAMGTFRATSDVDIALFGDRLTLADQARFAEAVGMLSMPQDVDILLYSSIEKKTDRAYRAVRGRVVFEERGAGHGVNDVAEIAHRCGEK